MKKRVAGLRSVRHREKSPFGGLTSIGLATYTFELTTSMGSGGQHSRRWSQFHRGIRIVLVSPVVIGASVRTRPL